MNNLGLQIGIASIVLALVGIAVTILLTRNCRPLWAIRSNAIQGVKHPDFEIRFRGSTIPNISSIRFVIWNAGNKEIRNEDIPSPNAGPRLQFSEETSLLSYEAVTTTGDNSAQLIPGDSKNLFVLFDYLNHGDAVLGEILCTTNDNSEPKTKVLGNFKGSVLRKGQLNNLGLGNDILFSIFGLILIAFAIIFAQLAYGAFLTNNVLRGFIPALFSLGLIFLAAIEIWANILPIPNKLPKKFKYYLDFGTLP